MKPINTSIYDFPTLVQTYVYVDKTAQIYELAKPGADILYYLGRIAVSANRFFCRP